MAAVDNKGEWACDTTGVAKLNGILYQKCWYNSVAGMFPTEAVECDDYVGDGYYETTGIFYIFFIIVYNLFNYNSNSKCFTIWCG